MTYNNGSPPHRTPHASTGDTLRDYREPTTLTEAEHRIGALTFSIQQIETHLGDRLRARDQSFDDYQRWRLNAQIAANAKREEKRRLTQWVKEYRRRGGKCRGLLREMVALHERLASDGVEYDEAEVARVKAAGAYLGELSQS